MSPFSLIPSGEVTDLAEDVRAIFDELAATLESAQRAYSGEYHPAIDVFETDDNVEIVVDVAGIAPEALRVVFRAGVLLIAGEKAPSIARTPQTFHLVEREFGRFARGVRLTGAFDLQASRASVRDGALTIVLPKRADRRGRPHRIPVTSDTERTA